MHRDDIIPRVAFIHHGPFQPQTGSRPLHTAMAAAGAVAQRAIIARCGVVRRGSQSWQKLAKACCAVSQAYLRVRLWLMMACLFNLGIWGKEFIQRTDRWKKHEKRRDVMVQRRTPLSLLAHALYMYGQVPRGTVWP
jgi:hypothetical protein